MPTAALQYFYWKNVSDKQSGNSVSYQVSTVGGDAMTNPKTDLVYLRSEKAKAEQKLRYYQHREKILERQIPELTRKARVHRLCTRAGMLESFLVCPEELTDDQVMELLKISFRQPEVAVALAQMVQDVQERRSVQNPLE